MKRKTHKPTMIREWRKHRGLTLERLADRVEVLTGLKTTAQTLSRIENGKIGYTQQMLEAIADALACEPADLIMRVPPSSDKFRAWSLLESLPEEKRRVALRMIEALSEAA
jgi:transcriptional regulator with XRE-family HTH domain